MILYIYDHLTAPVRMAGWHWQYWRLVDHDDDNAMVEDCYVSYGEAPLAYMQRFIARYGLENFGLRYVLSAVEDAKAAL